jgi:hypothetical protein
MFLQKDTKQKIIRDLAVSLFIYALPILLMFLSFYATGRRPWLDIPRKNSIHLTHQ